MSPNMDQRWQESARQFEDQTIDGRKTVHDGESDNEAGRVVIDLRDAALECGGVKLEARENSEADDMLEFAFPPAHEYEVMRQGTVEYLIDANVSPFATLDYEGSAASPSTEVNAMHEGGSANSSRTSRVKGEVKDAEILDQLNPPSPSHSTILVQEHIATPSSKDHKSMAMNELMELSGSQDAKDAVVISLQSEADGERSRADKSPTLSYEATCSNGVDKGASKSPPSILRASAPVFIPLDCTAMEVDADTASIPATSYLAVPDTTGGHSNSRKWASPTMTQAEAFARSQKGLKHLNIQSPFAPETLSEFINTKQRTLAMTQERLKRIIKDREGFSIPILKPFNGKTFQDGCTNVLAVLSHWSDLDSWTVEMRACEAPWPHISEYKKQSEHQTVTKKGRRLPLPRNPFQSETDMQMRSTPSGASEEGQKP